MTILKRVLLGFLVLAGLFMTGCGPDTIRGKEYPINDEKTVADDADLSIDERVQKIVDVRRRKGRTNDDDRHPRYDCNG